MIQLVEQIDIITYIANINGKKIVVYEFENDFIIFLHIEENRLLSLQKKDRLMSKYPPPFFKVTQKWLENGQENGTYHSHGGNALRLGQFFVNNYLHGVEGKDIFNPIQYP